MDEDYEDDGKFLKVLTRVRLGMEEDFSAGCVKKSELWDRILEKIKDEIPSLKYTREQINRKYLNLLTTYKRIKNRSLESGKIATTWEYFKDFDNAFGDRYPINTSTYPAPILDISEMLHNSFSGTNSQRVPLETLPDDPLKELHSPTIKEEYETQHQEHKRKLFDRSNDGYYSPSMNEDNFDNWSKKRREMLEIERLEMRNYENNDDYTPPCTNDDNFENWSKKRREMIEIERLEMRNYKIKLEIWEKEQQLQLASSKYTKDIVKN